MSSRRIREEEEKEQREADAKHLVTLLVFFFIPSKTFLSRSFIDYFAIL